MKIYSVTDKEFAPYGKVLGGYDKYASDAMKYALYRSVRLKEDDN